MKRALYALGWLASLACVGLFGRALMSHWSDVAQVRWDDRVLLASIAAFFLYVSTYALSAGIWQQCLRSLGQPFPYARAATILMVSQLGKYLPGNVGHHVGRVAMARNAGVATDLAVASVFLETLLVVLAGVICSLPAFALLLRVGLVQLQMHGNPSWTLTRLAIGLVIVSVLFGGWFCKRRLSSSVSALAPSAWLYVRACTVLCISFGLGGTALYLLATALSPTVAGGAALWMEVVGVYATAWLCGFVIPGSPAGLGVREFVLLLGLSPVYGPVSATMAAALLRLITVVGDGLVFSGGCFAYMRTLRKI